MSDIKIVVFRPLDSIILSKKFYLGHNKIINLLGYKSYYHTSNSYWFEMNNVFVVLALNSSGEAIGGLRIEKSMKELSLPLEKTIKTFDKKVYDKLDELSEDGGCGEICSLWASKEGFNLGLKTSYLIMCGIALMKQIGVKTLVSITIAPIGSSAHDVGARRLTEFGNNGFFPFMPGMDVSLDHFIYPDSIKFCKKKYLDLLIKMINEKNFTYELNNSKIVNFELSLS